jgi:hypothetical protein
MDYHVSVNYFWQFTSKLYQVFRTKLPKKWIKKPNQHKIFPKWMKLPILMKIVYINGCKAFSIQDIIKCKILCDYTTIPFVANLAFLQKRKKPYHVGYFKNLDFIW